MEITWYGLSCFKLAERGMATVTTDPYNYQEVGFSPLKLKADIVTVSHDAPGHNFLEAIYGAQQAGRSPYIITGPGEYEVGSVFITGIQTGGQKGSDHIRNTLYVFDFDRITVAHLGDINRPPTQAEIEAMGTVNIALVPVGGGGSLNAARAAEVVSQLEPNIVVPMHYATPDCTVSLDPLNKFLKEMGINDYQPLDILKINSASLPEETQVVVLTDQRG